MTTSHDPRPHSLDDHRDTAIVPFRPSSVSEAVTLADRLATSGLLPESLQKRPADVLVVLMTGHELGLSPMQAIRGIHVIKGRPVMSADLLVALVRASGRCEYIRPVESNERRAVYETKRRGEAPVRLEWTMDMAKRAGLAGKDNWQHYSAAMLRARAKADLCRAVYEDVVQGVVSREEVADGILETTAEDDAITITLADKTAEEWCREADAIAESIHNAPDVSTLEALLGDIRVLPDELRESLRHAYGEKLAAVTPAKKTTAIKDKLRGQAAASGNGSDKHITVDGASGEQLHPEAEAPKP
jgi:hypothetical protein